MGLMAGVAEHTCVMVRSHDLRELTRFGGVFLMASDAERGYVGERGLGRDRVAAVGVYRLRPMARFARNVSVLAGGARLGLIGVT